MCDFKTGDKVKFNHRALYNVDSPIDRERIMRDVNKVFTVEKVVRSQCFVEGGFQWSTQRFEPTINIDKLDLFIVKNTFETEE